MVKPCAQPSLFAVAGRTLSRELRCLMAGACGRREVVDVTREAVLRGTRKDTVDVTGPALRTGMRPSQGEELIVHKARPTIEMRRLPLIGAVTLPTILGESDLQVVWTVRGFVGIEMTRQALGRCRGELEGRIVSVA